MMDYKSILLSYNLSASSEPSNTLADMIRGFPNLVSKLEEVASKIYGPSLCILILSISALIFFIVLWILENKCEKLESLKVTYPNAAGQKAVSQQSKISSNSESDSKIVLQGISGYYNGQRFEFSNSITFGRDGSVAQLIYPPDTQGISRQHARIQKSNGYIQITDLNSSYGTFVNGIKMSQGGTQGIKSGDTISLGGNSNGFRVL